MHWAKSFGDLKQQKNISEHWKPFRWGMEPRDKEYVHGKVSLDPSSAFFVMLSLKETAVFSSFTLTCLFADFHLWDAFPAYDEDYKGK